MKHQANEVVLFAQLRQLPPELSRDQVKTLIKGLPLLPPPKPVWLLKLQSNLFIMTFTSIITTACIVFFFNVNENTPTVIATDDTQNLNAQVIVTENSMDTVVKEIAELNETIPENTIATEASTSAEAKEEKEPTRDSRSPSDSGDQLVSGQQLTAPIVPPVEDTGKLPVTRTPVEKNSPGNKDAKSGADLIPRGNCDVELQFLGDAKNLRRELMADLISDRLVPTSTQKIRFSFTKYGIAVNQKLVTQSLQTKYKVLFEKYGIEACPLRIVEITPDYLAAGDITREGFRGKVNGSVDLQVLNRIKVSELQILSRHSSNESGFKEFQNSQSEERPIGSFHSLRVRGLAVVHLYSGNANTVKVEVAGMPIADVLTSVKKGYLTVTTRGEHNGEKIRVTVYAPRTLKSIEVGGAAELYSKEKIKTGDLDIMVEDVGAAWLDVEAATVNIYMAGGDLDIAGTADRQKISEHGRDAKHGTLTNRRLKVQNRQ
ncbi:MAG: DUF2807 domain-containing protein [Bacteroidota bacterium]